MHIQSRIVITLRIDRLPILGIKNCQMITLIDTRRGISSGKLIKNKYSGQVLSNFDNLDIDDVVAQAIAEIEETQLSNSMSSTILDDSYSSLISIIITDYKMYISSVGDCECLLSSSNGRTIKSLIQAHNIEQKQEVDRIYRENSHIFSLQTAVGSDSISVCRYYNKKDYLAARSHTKKFFVFPGELNVMG